MGEPGVEAPKVRVRGRRRRLYCIRVGIGPESKGQTQARDLTSSVRADRPGAILVLGGDRGRSSCRMARGPGIRNLRRPNSVFLYITRRLAV